MRTRCISCNKEMDVDNTALCQKLYGKETTKFLCYECMSRQEEFPVEKLYDLVRYYREMGCMLFTPLAEEVNNNGGIL